MASASLHVVKMLCFDRCPLVRLLDYFRFGQHVCLVFERLHEVPTLPLSCLSTSAALMQDLLSFRRVEPSVSADTMRKVGGAALH